MSDSTAGTLFFVVALGIFWPWMVGVVDLASWMITGTGVTSIPWESWRGLMMFLWPLFGVGAVLVVSELIP